jgi:hypothetical protein
MFFLAVLDNGDLSVQLRSLADMINPVLGPFDPEPGLLTVCYALAFVVLLLEVDSRA